MPARRLSFIQMQLLKLKPPRHGTKTETLLLLMPLSTNSTTL
jgi:hypothetical protein